MHLACISIYDTVYVYILNIYIYINNIILKIRKHHAGPDGITNELLKALPNKWLDSLTSIFNKVLQSNEYPTKWSESILKPIYKSGDRNQPNNYRGKSLISCIGKLFTTLLADRISTWLKNSSIICKKQFGFRRRRRRTTDAVFILQSLIRRQILKKETIILLFC